MSHRIDEKDRRRQKRLAAKAAAAHVERRHRRRTIAFWVLAGALVSGLVSAAFVLPKSEPTPAMTSDAAHARPVAGASSRAPDFRATDVVSGKSLSLADLRGKRTLLFFSEGASCQACLVQAAELQKAKGLRRAGIGLVSVATDSPEVLRQAAAQYGITTPLLADATKSMSMAYGQLGRGGMGHPDTDGHSFVLLDPAGRVTWERAYQEMYVPTQRLIADMAG